MNVSVLIATFGGLEWSQLAVSRAAPSAWAAYPYEVLTGHQPDGTVCTSRNALARKAAGDWLCFLDADDELEPGFVGSMGRALERAAGTDGYHDRCLFTPAIQRRQGTPFFYPERDLRDANWLVIGTLIHRDLFWEVGGFNEETPQGFEDWELWSRCSRAGARVVKVPQAVYRVHQGRMSSRNHASLFRRDERAYMAEYHRVRQGVWPELYEGAACG